MAERRTIGVVAVIAGTISGLLLIVLLQLAFYVHPWLGWSVLAAAAWYGPVVGVARYVWHRYQQDTSAEG